MTPPEKPGPSDDESPRSRTLRQLFRLIAAVQAAESEGRSIRRSIGGGPVAGGIHVGTIDGLLEGPDHGDPGRSAPHLVTRRLSDAYLIVADLQGISRDDVSVLRDVRAESLVIDAAGHRRRRTPIPPDHEIESVQMRNGILEIRLGETAETGGENSDE